MLAQGLRRRHRAPTEASPAHRGWTQWARQAAPLPLLMVAFMALVGSQDARPFKVFTGGVANASKAELTKWRLVEHDSARTASRDAARTQWAPMLAQGLRRRRRAPTRGHEGTPS